MQLPEQVFHARLGLDFRIEQRKGSLELVANERGRESLCDEIAGGIGRQHRMRNTRGVGEAQQRLLAHPAANFTRNHMVETGQHELARLWCFADEARLDNLGVCRTLAHEASVQRRHPWLRGIPCEREHDPGDHGEREADQARQPHPDLEAGKAHRRLAEAEVLDIGQRHDAIASKCRTHASKILEIRAPPSGSPPDAAGTCAASIAPAHASTGATQTPMHVSRLSGDP